MCELRISQVTTFRLYKVFSILHLIENGYYVLNNKHIDLYGIPF